jgi:hypothetical protein
MGGGGFWMGLGPIEDRGIVWYSPSNSTGSVVQIALSTAIDSSKRLILLSQEAPAAMYSSSDQPCPSPTRSRPFESTSMVARRRDSSIGLYQGRLMTACPRVWRLV